MKKSIGVFEKNILIWAEEKSVFLYLILAFIASVIVRVALFPYISDDMTTYLLGWYMQIEQLGGLKALNVQVGNYNVLYQTIIAMLTYLPGEIVVKYKVVSCIFDYVIALAVFLILYDKEEKDTFKEAVIAMLLVIFSPIVFLNSGAWGQCDAVYTAFVLLSFGMYKKNKLTPCFVFFGLAFAFKLQAIFYLPFYLFEWVRRKDFSILKFLYIPVTMIFVCIPAYINGRNFWGFISPYYYQTGSCQKMSYNYPSFWTIISDSSVKRVEYVSTMKTPAILITIMMLAGLMIWILSKKKQLTDTLLLELFFILGFTCVEFLPGMHERYGFGIELLAIILAFRNKRTIPLALIINLLSLVTYGAELYGREMNLGLLGIVNLFCYLAYIYLLGKETQVSS